MDHATYERYYRAIRKRLQPQRFHHSLGTMLTAVSLAERWGADSIKAATAGILHDVARDFPHITDKRYLKRIGVEIPLEDNEFPQLWHARAAGVFVKTELGVDDEEISRAILLHPTGEEAMSLLEKIVFLSDYLEPTRSFEGAGKLRILMYENLERALAAALETKIRFIADVRRYPLHPRAKRALRWYSRNKEILKYVTQH